MANFVKAAATAKRLIEANGRVVEIFKHNRTPSNTARPWEGTRAQPGKAKDGANIRLKMVFVPVSGSGFGTLIEKAASTSAKNFTQVGMLASDSIPAGFTPDDIEKADRVRDGDRIWSIVVRDHLRPADKSVIFLLGLSR